MPKIMLIDAAQVEETRVAVMDGKRLENFDIESASKKQLKGNIYLAKVTRVEPSLQAAFVNYGGNRHGFLPFAEIHPDYYRIPVEDRERLLAEQEELRREMQEEAKRREEREIAEAEAAAQNPQTIVEENLDAEPQEFAEELSAEDRQPNEDLNPEALRPEDVSDEAFDAAEADEDADEGDDLQSDLAMAEGQEGDAEQMSEGVPAEGADAQVAEGDDNRGRNRRGRGRNRRGRGRGADRQRPDRLVDRDARRDTGRDTGRDSGGEEDESHVERLWKRMRRSYKIQEVIKRGQIMLIQVVKEERGNKGAAVTSYITMPGRYCVLMPNSPQSGGVSRKVASHSDRKKMRAMLDDLQVPAGMSVILRTAGVDREPEDVKRDLDYLMRLWDRVRDTTMQSTAPSLIHEEGSLVKRAIRDLYSSDISEIIVEGEEGARSAAEMMDMMMPGHANRIQAYSGAVPLFTKYGAEPQIDAIHSTSVTLRSGGYIVINPTEALVSIDINSGRATRERHIEETALKTNLEAADEIGRQLRLRDLGGLVVIDFIDMESRRNNSLVEKRLRDALSGDRARVQIGRISSFGLLELSRQRLRPSLTETHFQTCPHCRGTGMTRTTEALALAVIRAIETAGMEGRADEVDVTVPEAVGVFLFNAKRATIGMLEQRYDLTITLKIAPVIESEHGFTVEVARSRRAERLPGIDATVDPDLMDEEAGNDVPGNAVQEHFNDDETGQPQVHNTREGGFENRGEGNREGGRNGNREGGRRRGGRGRNRRGGRDRDGVDNAAPRQPADPNMVPVADAQPDFDDDIGNRKTDEQGNEFDGNIMGAEQAVRSEGGRNRGGRGRDRGGRGRGPRPNASGEQRNERGGDRGNRGPRPERGHDRGNDRGGNRQTHQPVDDNIGNRAPKEETRVAYQSRPRSEDPSSESRNRDYEVVNEVSGDKKKGWWKKLTG